MRLYLNPASAPFYLCHRNHCLYPVHIVSLKQYAPYFALIIVHCFFYLIALLVIVKYNMFNSYLSPSLFSIPYPSTHRMSSAATRSLRAHVVGKLLPTNTTLLICDIQERFRPLIHKMETVIQTSKFMTSVASELDIPIVVTQQYTKVFGPTISDAVCHPHELFLLGSSNSGSMGNTKKMPVFEKKKFSMMTDEVSTHIASLNRTSFLLVGIEAHVCVQQTCLDLLELGHEVHVIADGVSSQQSYDREMALRRMENCGAYLTTAQSAAFMLLGSAEHENFKAVSGLVKDHMVLRNEFNE